MRAGARPPFQTLGAGWPLDGWRSLVIVGHLEPAQATTLVTGLANCAVTFVCPFEVRVAAAEGPTRKAHLRAAMTRARVLRASYPLRCGVIEEEPLAAAANQPDYAFDAVALLEADYLEALGLAWARKVKEGGMLLGLDYRDEAVRALLKDALPQWVRHDAGVWSARIRRPVAALPPETRPTAIRTPRAPRKPAPKRPVRRTKQVAARSTRGRRKAG